MLRDHFLIFDDFLVGDSDSLDKSQYDRTSDAFCVRLAAYDLLSVFLVMEDYGGASGTLSVKYETSGDGVEFSDKDDVNLFDEYPWLANGTTLGWAFDDGSSPPLTYGRLIIWGSGSAAQHLRVRVYVALRDLDEMVQLAYKAPPKTAPDPRAAAAQAAAKKNVAQEHEYGPRGPRIGASRPPTD